MIVSRTLLTFDTIRSADETFSCRFALPMIKFMPVAPSNELFPFMSLKSSAQESFSSCLVSATCDLCASNTKLSNQPLVF